MAQRVKRKYRGRTYTVKSQRPGKRTVKVRAYCRRKGGSAWKKAAQTAKDYSDSAYASNH